MYVSGARPYVHLTSLKNLYQDLLSHLQRRFWGGCDSLLSLAFRSLKYSGPTSRRGKKTVLFAAVMDKTPLADRAQLSEMIPCKCTGDGFLDGPSGCLKIDQLAVIYNGHRSVQMNRVDKHLFFHNDPFVGFQYSASLRPGARSQILCPAVTIHDLNQTAENPCILYKGGHIAFSNS